MKKYISRACCFCSKHFRKLIVFGFALSFIALSILSVCFGPDVPADGLLLYVGRSLQIIFTVCLVGVFCMVPKYPQYFGI